MTGVMLLTGGTGNFGKVLVPYFADQGWRVITTSRSQLRLSECFSDFKPTGGEILGIEVDLQQPGASRRLIDELSGRGVSITHLISNARSLETLAVKSDGTTVREVFLGEFEMDVIVPYELTIALSKSENHRLKTVVNIGSMYGELAPNPALYGGSLDRSPVQYGVSKAALHHLTRELAVRLSAKNIRVNCVAFGGVEGRVDEAFYARYAQMVPSRRMLRSEEIIGPVDFLINDASSAVNGHVLVADGGWGVW